MNGLKHTGLTIGAIFILFLNTIALTPAAQAETIKCTECGMISELASPFTSRIVAGDKTEYFCDIGDLFSYLNKKKPANVRIEVKDYASGAWIEAQTASYVRAQKKFQSPMGWGIAAFKDSKVAAGYGTVMDMNAGMKAVR